MGDVMGGGQSGGGSQSVSQTQTSEPWGPQQPYILSGLEAVKNNFLKKKSDPQFYPYNTAVPFSPETNAAMQMQTQRALFGSPIQDAGTDQLTRTMRGDYLNQVGDLYNNPMQQLVNNSYLAPTISGENLYGGAGFNAALDAARNKILPQINSAFGQAGRSRSGLADVAKTQALSDAFASQYGQERQLQSQAAQQAQAGTGTFLDALNNEKQRMLQATLTAPQFAQLPYQDAAKLAEVGAQKEALEQQNLNKNISQWDYDQNKRRNAIAQYMGLVQGNYGGTTTGSSTTTASPAGSGPNIMGGLGGMLMSQSLGVSPIMGLMGGLGF